jgi:uncharacterized protein YjdB
MRVIFGLSVMGLGVLGLTSCGGGGDGTAGPPSPVASVSLDPGSPQLTVGQALALTATPRDQAGNSLTGRAVTWSSNNTDVATVSDAGLVTALALGEAIVSATSEGVSGSTTAHVAPAPVASVRVTPSTLGLAIGETGALAAAALDAAGNVLPGRVAVWASADEAIATVSDAGVVTGVGAGGIAVRATIEGKSSTATVTVRAPVGSVSVSPESQSLVVGQSVPFTPTLRDEAGNVLVGRSVTWESSDAAVARVSASGVVTALAVGAATITATSEGKSGSATVAVTSGTYASVTFASVAAGGAHSCALTAGGAAYCWGRGESGQLGVPSPATSCATDGGAFPCSKIPVAVGGGRVFDQLAGGGAHTCGLTGDGSAYCWGDNGSGQLGDNSTTDRTTPVAVATGLKFASIDAGAQHTCALTGSGSAYCWGRNDRGQLGDGTTTSRSVPVAVTGSLSLRMIAAGGFDVGQTCALTNAGDAYCWGNNERGQLGLGTSDVAAHAAPAPVSGGLTFTVLTAGLGRHTCALTATGAAYCWGENSFGALGDGSSTDRPVPTPVSGEVDFAQVMAGGFIGHTCGLTGSGAAHCWGDNEVGQVGDGSTTDRLEPVAVAGGHAFTRLDAGFRHTCGRASTGTVYCWGSNGAGQLGNDSNSPSAVPAKVVGQP